MQQIIQQITQQFVDRLPENDQYYRLDELRSWDIPSFIVQRIKIELERNLAESMIIPKTDWANTKSDAVLDAWQKFVDAIRAEARLPASYGKTVIETAVADVVEMLVQPRKNIPAVIFGTEDELTMDKVRHRLQAVVVYPHFSRLILRYMQKKNMDALSKDRCAKIIADADAKLTAGYSPLNWAQMLEPLFGLVDGIIDTHLLRLFYEDKNMPRIARKFDLMNDSLSRAEFIEVLSSPDLLDFEGYEDDQSSLFKDQPKSSSTQPRKTMAENVDEDTEPEADTKAVEDTELGEHEEPIDQEEPTEEEHEASESAKILNLEDDQLDSDLPDKEQISEILFSKHKLNEEQSLYSNFVETDKRYRGEDEGDSLNAVFRDEEGEKSKKKSEKDKAKGEKQKEDSHPKKEQKKNAQSESNGEQHKGNGQEKTPEGDEETPIWMRYMSDEESEEYEQEEEQEDTDEDGFIEEPIIDLTQQDASDEEVETLKKALQSDRDLFVEEIFGGSERAFDVAVKEIAAYNSWKDVSKYIEEDIFKRNLVDVYSEAAVDFTDRLQTYFIKKQG